MNDDPRFGSLARLLGRNALETLRRARVAVVGVGGVGSWTVEALARSGVGRLTLIDMDDVCVTNINRQLPALSSTVGRPKVDVLARRILDIHPACEVTAIPEFLTASNAERLLEGHYDFVVDATDRMSVKAQILAACRSRGVPALTIGAAGGRSDPAQVRCADLGLAGSDNLLRIVRRKLRRSHGWEGGEGNIYGVPAIFSPEPPAYPWADGSICAGKEPGSSLRMDCSTGFGAACFVTGTFGFLAAGEVVRRIVARHSLTPPGDSLDQTTLPISVAPATKIGSASSGRKPTFTK